MSTPEEAARELDNYLMLNTGVPVEILVEIKARVTAALLSAREDEREACAKIAENANLDHKWAGDECAGIAAAIRERKKPDAEAVKRAFEKGVLEQERVIAALTKERDELKGCCGCNATKQAICPEHLRLISQLRQMREFQKYVLDELFEFQDHACFTESVCGKRECELYHRIAKKALGQGGRE